MGYSDCIFLFDDDLSEAESSGPELSGSELSGSEGAELDVCVESDEEKQLQSLFFKGKLGNFYRREKVRPQAEHSAQGMSSAVNIPFSNAKTVKVKTIPYKEIQLPEKAEGVSSGLKTKGLKKRYLSEQQSVNIVYSYCGGTGMFPMEVESEVKSEVKPSKQNKRMK